MDQASGAAGERAGPVAGALRQALAADGFRGEVLSDWATRAAMSTDNSVYQIWPDVIVAPVDHDDVVRLMSVLDRPAFRALAVTARGGGTGTNGQSLNTGIVVDFRRHMNRVLAVDAADGWADVEPGLVLDDLNAQIAGTGLFFAPNTSTASRCTIGGMVSTDASGKGSRLFGKTSDNVLGLRIVLADGRTLDSDEPRPAWAAGLMDRLAAACDLGRADLLRRVPHLSRRFTGYDLERARPAADRLEWWRLLLGAEGTLGLVTRIRVRLVRRPKATALAVLAFSSFAEALDAGPRLLAAQPLAIEVIDGWVQRLARDAGLVADLPAAVRSSGDASVSYDFVEFADLDGRDPTEAARALMEWAAGLPGLVGAHLATEPAEIARLWSIRTTAVGLLGRSEGSRRPVAFVEDTVVPVENLAAFVGEFDALMARHGLRYGIYGHVDVGCLHVRPALDLESLDDRRLLKSVSDAVFDLAVKHGGIFWGEHGKGIRGAYLERFVGKEAYRAFQLIRQAFDPGERLNPGKLVALSQSLHGVLSTRFRTVRDPATDGLRKAFDCNGNGQCLNVARTTTICPSYKATGDLRQSPKGRADAVREWRKASAAHAPEAPAMAAATYAALETCLGCGACATGCPVEVDIPALKSAFLEEYFRTARRPPRHVAAMSVELFSAGIARLRPLARLLAPSAFAIAERMLGFADLPSLSSAGEADFGYAVLGSRRAAASAWADNTVFVVGDAFTRLFDTPAIGAVCDGLAALGYHPAIVRLPAGAKAAGSLGARRHFAARARPLIAALRALAHAGRPIVGVDPAFVLMLRREYREIAPDMPEVLMVQELLARASRSWPAARPDRR